MGHGTPSTFKSKLPTKGSVPSWRFKKWFLAPASSRGSHGSSEKEGGDRTAFSVTLIFVVNRASAHVLEEEMPLLNKPATRPVPNQETHWGFYSQYVLIPKKGALSDDWSSRCMLPLIQLFSVRPLFGSEGIQEVCESSAVSTEKKPNKNIFIHRQPSHTLWCCITLVVDRPRNADILSEWCRSG